MSKKIEAYLIDEKQRLFAGLRNPKFSKLYFPVISGIMDRGVLVGSFKKGTLNPTWDVSYKEVTGLEDQKFQERIEKGDFYKKLEIEEEIVKLIIENGREMNSSTSRLYANLNSLKL
jgi:hypothetical protein